MRQKKNSIFVIGDSISIHYGPYLEIYLKNGFTYSRKTGEDGLIDLDNPRGANGGDSSMVLEYLGGDLPFNRPDFLLINCGLHDLKTDPDSGKKQIPINRYRENLEKIAVAAQTAAGQMVWIRSTPVHDETHQSKGKPFNRYNQDVIRYNRTADEVMREHGIPAIDLYGFTINIEENLYCDHVHFTIPVRKLQAAYIAGWITGFSPAGNTG
ncbi:MAG: SGNH/GDSL hydrolase family protein [Spirochaetia bacterium]